jgi:hypothetical protein
MGPVSTGNDADQIERGDDPVTPAVFREPNRPKERPPEGGLGKV